MIPDNIETYKNGIVYPRIAPERFGCATSDLRLIPESLLYRDWGRYGQLWRPYPQKKHCLRTVIYAGILMGHHYGHFLLDSLSRLWYAAKNPDLPICWSGNEYECAYVPFEKEIIKALGIKNETIFITEATSFEHVIIPSPGYIMASYFSEKYRHFISHVPASKIITGKKIYLSRRKIAPTALNEKDLEKELKKIGFSIYFPEEHTFSEQFAELTSSELILGIMGSAIHTLILAKDLQSKIILLSRPHWVDQNYKFIADRNGWDQLIFNNIWLQRIIDKAIPWHSTGVLDIPKILNIIDKFGSNDPLRRFMLKAEGDEIAIDEVPASIYRKYGKKLKNLIFGKEFNKVIM